MIRSARVIAALAAAALALVACGRVSSTGGVTVANVYAGGVTLADIGTYLGDSTNWLPGPPQFGVRPLDVSTTPEQQRFVLTLHFVHIGSGETLDVVYRVWNSSSLASAIISSTQQAVGSSSSGPSAGDQVVYFNQKIPVGAAEYVSEAAVRVGAINTEIVWSRTGAYASTNTMGAIAKRVASKLKNGLSGHAQKPQPPDPHFLPPDGTDLTQLGVDSLPVEVVPVMVGAPNPGNVAGIFHHLGAEHFVYGDYALNADTHMQVMTAAFDFATSTGASDWLNQFIGSSSLGQSGDYFNYDDASGQYIVAFGVGSEGVLMLCRSSAGLEAASRACEGPMSRVASGWKQELGG